MFQPQAAHGLQDVKPLVPQCQGERTKTALSLRRTQKVICASGAARRLQISDIFQPQII